jgi:hypothetical protein
MPEEPDPDSEGDERHRAHQNHPQHVTSARSQSHSQFDLLDFAA